MPNLVDLSNVQNTVGITIVKQIFLIHIKQCPGGRLFSLNVTVSNMALRKDTFQRVMVPYPEAGQWFLTLLPSCSKINVRRGNQET